MALVSELEPPILNRQYKSYRTVLNGTGYLRQANRLEALIGQCGIANAQWVSNRPRGLFGGRARSLASSAELFRHGRLIVVDCPRGARLGIELKASTECSLFRQWPHTGLFMAMNSWKFTEGRKQLITELTYWFSGWLMCAKFRNFNLKISNYQTWVAKFNLQVSRSLLGPCDLVNFSQFRAQRFARFGKFQIETKRIVERMTQLSFFSHHDCYSSIWILPVPPKKNTVIGF